jgi:hypothetical protein
MDEAALFGCIDWVAQGFEIVHLGFSGLEVRAAVRIRSLISWRAQ